MREAATAPLAPPQAEPKRLAFFERYLTLWVFFCMVAGVTLARALPQVTSALSALEFGRGSQANVPIGVLLWLMMPAHRRASPARRDQSPPRRYERGKPGGALDSRRC